MIVESNPRSCIKMRGEESCSRKGEEVIEDPMYIKKFTTKYCLSNPRYALHGRQTSRHGGRSGERRRWNRPPKVPIGSSELKIALIALVTLRHAKMAGDLRPLWSPQKTSYLEINNLSSLDKSHKPPTLAASCSVCGQGIRPTNPRSTAIGATRRGHPGLA